MRLDFSFLMRTCRLGHADVFQLMGMYSYKYKLMRQVRVRSPRLCRSLSC